MQREPGEICLSARLQFAKHIEAAVDGSILIAWWRSDTYVELNVAFAKPVDELSCVH